MFQYPNLAGAISSRRRVQRPNVDITPHTIILYSCGQARMTCDNPLANGKLNYWWMKVASCQVFECPTGFLLQGHQKVFKKALLSIKSCEDRTGFLLLNAQRLFPLMYFFNQKYDLDNLFAAIETEDCLVRVTPCSGSMTFKTRKLSDCNHNLCRLRFFSTICSACQ